MKAAWLVDWGAGLAPYALYQNAAADNSLISAVSGNLWLRLSLPAQWQLYARVKDTLLLSFLPTPAAGEFLTNLWDIDALWFKGSVPEAGFSFAIGRQLYVLGSGLLLAGTGDGVDFNLLTSLVQVKVFGFYTGLVRPDFSGFAMGAWDRANGPQRYGAGYRLAVNLFGQELALAGFYQGDAGLDSSQLYTSWYAGLQAEGLLFSGNYLVEAYLQDGYSPDSTGIAAFGGTARYQLAFPVTTTPTATLQYSLASGDPDRLSSQGAIGNAADADTAFQTFGQLNSGLAFRPYFSNINILHAGFSFTPFESLAGALRRSSLGLRYFYYFKYAASGVVNYGEATVDSADLGHGIDLTTSWSPFNDVGFFLNAGLFLPGAAFGAGEPLRIMVVSGLTLSF